MLRRPVAGSAGAWQRLRAHRRPSRPAAVVCVADGPRQRRDWAL